MDFSYHTATCPILHEIFLQAGLRCSLYDMKRQPLKAIDTKAGIKPTQSSPFWSVMLTATTLRMVLILHDTNGKSWNLAPWWLCIWV